MPLSQAECLRCHVLTFQEYGLFGFDRCYGTVNKAIMALKMDQENTYNDRPVFFIKHIIRLSII